MTISLTNQLRFDLEGSAEACPNDFVYCTRHLLITNVLIFFSGAGDVDGAWSDWSSWTQCSKTCGGGIKARERSCTNPPPKGNGQSCLGEVEETGACSQNPCPKRKF